MILCCPTLFSGAYASFPSNRRAKTSADDAAANQTNEEAG